MERSLIDKSAPGIGAEGVVLHPVELDAGTMASLNSMLKLLDARTKRAWRIQADAAAPVYITHTHSDFARSMRNARPGRSGGSRLQS